MLQLNLNTKYNHLYWLVAVLNTNAGAIEVDEDAKQRDNDYGKVAKAVDDLAQQGIRVAPPLINTADYSFTPDIKNNQIIYSLKAIRGVNEQVTNVILEKRPFDSFEDFIERAVEATDVIKPTNVVQLIKAGVFSEFGNTREIMAKYIMSLISPKDKLNGQNLNRCINMGLFTEEWKDYVEIFNLRTTVNKQVHKKVTKPNDTLLRVKPEQINVLTNHLGSGIIVEYEGQDTIISKKELDKEYKTFIEPLIEHMNTEDFLKKYNQALFVEEWIERTKGGTVEKWAMDSLTYYPDKHELDSVVEARYNISNFFELDENPEPLGYSKWNGREFPYYQIGTIMGTVIDKNNTKHTVTLLTKEGVVICKLYAGLYAHYNKAIKSNGVTIEDSWFKRGNLLLVNGYRRGEQWVVKKSKQQEHSISLITDVQEGGVLSLQNERVNL